MLQQGRFERTPNIEWPHSARQCWIRELLLGLYISCAAYFGPLTCIRVTDDEIHVSAYVSYRISTVQASNLVYNRSLFQHLSFTS